MLIRQTCGEAGAENHGSLIGDGRIVQIVHGECFEYHSNGIFYRFERGL